MHQNAKRRGGVARVAERVSGILLRRTFLHIWMTASKKMFCFMVWPLPETAMGILCNCLVGALPDKRYEIRSFNLCGVTAVLPGTNCVTRPPTMPTANKKWKRPGYPDCLAHAVIGAFYSVIANRRQTNLYMYNICLLYTSPSPRDKRQSRMPSSA